jgi:diaminopimelate epimerase
MGKPVFSHSDFPDKKIKMEGLELDFVSMGNPHAVALVDDLDIFDLKKIGPKVENDSIFPNKINLELVEKKDDKKYKVAVWERGCGITMACGTGACAVYAIIQKQNNMEAKSAKGGSPDASAEASREIVIELSGGELFIKENENGEIIMRGEAKSSFRGEAEI